MKDSEIFKICVVIGFGLEFGSQMAWFIFDVIKETFRIPLG